MPFGIPSFITINELIPFSDINLAASKAVLFSSIVITSFVIISLTTATIITNFFIEDKNFVTLVKLGQAYTKEPFHTVDLIFVAIRVTAIYEIYSRHLNIKV